MKRLSTEELDLTGIKMSGGPPVATVIVEAEHRKHLKLGWLVVVLGFGGFLTIAVNVPLAGGITLNGVVTYASSHSVIQHQSGGVMDKLYVHEGSPVHKGDVLIQLNDADPKAQLVVAEEQNIGVKVLEARLRSERDNLHQVEYDKDLLLRFGNDQRLWDAVKLQDRLFASRAAARETERNIFRGQLATLRSQSEGYEVLRKARQAQSASLHEELRGIASLANGGYVPRNRLLQLERSVSDLDAAKADVTSNITRILNSQYETQLHMLAREQDFEREIGNQLVDVEREVIISEERLKAAERSEASTQVRTPVDGVVQNLAISTVGSLVQPGAHIMEIVPNNMPLIVETQISPDRIDKVKLGDKVTLNFNSLVRQKVLSIPGTVSMISPDRMNDPRTGSAYYALKATVSPEDLRRLGRYQLKSGMNAMVVIGTGERTMLNYLVQPFRDFLHGAFSEE